MKQIERLIEFLILVTASLYAAQLHCDGNQNATAIMVGSIIVYYAITGANKNDG